jgi:hypothetical protein
LLRLKICNLTDVFGNVRLDSVNCGHEFVVLELKMFWLVFDYQLSKIDCLRLVEPDVLALVGDLSAVGDRDGGRVSVSVRN